MVRLILLCVVSVLTCNPLSAADEPSPKTRAFTFHYRFRAKNLRRENDSGDNKVRVWLPCPSDSDCQTVSRSSAATPMKLSEHTESRYGNRVLFFETEIPATGELVVDVPYEVTRSEVLRKPRGLQKTAAELLDDMQRALYLRSDRLVPTTGKPLQLLTGVKLRSDKGELARQLYDLVDDHVVYKKEGTGWGRGDTNWVCDSRHGNCTDFHSLFMSLARSQGLPTRFEIGCSIPADRSAGPIAGYHCWAWFYLDSHGWIPVDISEADKHPELKEYYFGNLTADRMTFSIGRDLELVPKATQSPLNFFIYPHVEIGGQALPMEDIEMQWAFEDRK